MLKPEVCPLCDAEWKEIVDKNTNSFVAHFQCGRFDTCHLELYHFTETMKFFVVKMLEDDKTEVWWSFDDGCEVKIDTVYRKISFVPPYDISLKRLNLLLPFD